MKLILRDVCKDVTFNDQRIHILTNVNMEIRYGEITAIIGSSGSGKTTLLNIMSLIDRVSSGNYYIGDVNVSSWDDNQKSEFRRAYSSIVFQQYNLVSRLSSYDNVKLPLLVNRRINSSDRRAIVLESLKRLGMEHRKDHKPSTLSGGEQQRIAIARALVNNPATIFADEPTGNVDKGNESIILKAFRDMAEEGRAVIIVTHSETVRDYSNKVFRLKHGEISEVVQ
ncbi:MAG: ABC transporter ATP-binding protein [Peptococcaceae bacterium]|nr:ABC transporter ATP-binding protein [Peptococcaceae bacterium]